MTTIMPRARCVQLLAFRKRRRTPILFSTPKGGAGLWDGWDYNKEHVSDGAAMTYTFKLSRRMARFRTVLPLTAFFLGVACAGDPSGPGSTGAAGPSSIRISPDSVSLAVNEAVQLQASTDTSSGTAMLSRSGKGRGRPKQTIVSLAVTPQNTALGTGASNRFSATATLSDGSVVEPSVSWTATGGTVDSTGLFTAGSVPGAYSAIANTRNGIADTATITVTASAPVVTRITLSPATTTLAEGSATRFSAIGKASDGSTVGVSPAFSATGGTVTSAGVYTAGTTPGSFRVIARDSVTGLADTSAVTVTDPVSTLQSVVLTPSSASLTAGANQQFTASGKMSDGTTTSITASYAATGGSITTAGVYTAGATAGTYRVIATEQATGRADTAAVTIASVVTSVSVSPTSASLTSGQTSQLTATVKDGSGTVVPGQSVSWSSLNTAVATVSSTGLVTAVAPGSTTVKATSGGVQGQAAISVASPTPSTADGCPASGYLRLVNVSSQAQLVAAVNAAQPGDQIRMAAGTYVGSIVPSRSGTQANPITLCGPRTAIIDNNNGYIQQTGHWWVMKNFTITDGLIGLYILGGSNNVYDSLEIKHMGQEGVELRTTASNNLFRANWIHDTGETTAIYGEAFYVGNGTTQADPANYNRFIGNRTGPNVRAEHFDVKAPTQGTIATDNVMDATGTLFNYGNVSAIVTVNGTGATFSRNTITNIGSSSLSGFMVWQGSNIIFHDNAVRNGTFQTGFRVSTSGSGNVVGCDNVVVGGTFANVACQ
jgi:uncharacterized protein YjdB/heat shock protein HslJ